MVIGDGKNFERTQRYHGYKRVYGQRGAKTQDVCNEPQEETTITLPSNVVLFLLHRDLD